MPRSPNLCREISGVKTNKESTELIFKNNSSFITGVSGEGSRGLRSTILIIDEFRLVDEEVKNDILVPTMIQRPAVYLEKEEYRYLVEEPKQIYLSSAFWKSHWMWDTIRYAMKGVYKNEAVLFSTDYFTTIKYGIKTRKQMIQAKSNSGELGWLMEYCNIMLGGSDNQYYSYELINKAQCIPKAWYPRTVNEYFDTTEEKRGKRVKTKSWFGDIPKKEDELRIITADIALSSNTKNIKNDYTVIKCIRALVSGKKYERQEVYIESHNGVSLDKQAIRMRQLIDDFEADVLVLDARNFGTVIFDEFAKVLYDTERDVEYEPIKCMNDDHYASRCLNSNAIPMVYAFVGTTDRNDEMHKQMKSALMTGHYKMLIPYAKCEEEYLNKHKQYKLGTEEEKGRFRQPYIRSDLTLNEMINLNQEFIGGGQGKIKLVEPSSGTKDSYISSAMGNYFISERELELMSEDTWDNFDGDNFILY